MSNVSKNALITGGAGDLARAATAALEKEGWQVRGPGRAELDVLKEESVVAYFVNLTSLDLLIANAGIIEDQTLAKMPEDSWDRVVDTNLRGAFLCARAALPALRAARGQILFIGSRSAQSGPIGQAAYAAAKAGLVGFSQSLAKELGAEDIRCNVVLPGFLETKMTLGVSLSSPEGRKRILASHALGRLNTLEEAGRAIAFLASLTNASGQVYQFDSRIDRWT